MLDLCLIHDVFLGKEKTFEKLWKENGEYFRWKCYFVTLKFEISWNVGLFDIIFVQGCHLKVFFT